MASAEAPAPTMLSSLEGFVMEQVLMEDKRTKFAALLGKFPGSSTPDLPAVVRLSARALPEQGQLPAFFAVTALTNVMLNNVYSKYVGHPAAPHGGLNVDIVYPASAKDISRNTEQTYHMVRETPAMHAAVVAPHIAAQPQSRIQWVLNILDKQAETERIVFEDPHPQTGFIILPDQKWDQTQSQQLYCTAITVQRGLTSLRQLTGEHLPLLKNILDKGCQALTDKFGVSRDELRVYLHYLPSYFHLHVHFVHLKSQGFGNEAGKAVLLQDVIDNMETFGGDCYSRMTLNITLGEEDELWKKLKAWDGGEAAAKKQKLDSTTQ
ncbi:MAG: hypothetical protein WDW38_000300 [Sanguina aurantia]